MNFAAWIAFMLAYLLVAATPGPTTMLITSYGLAHGRRTAPAVIAGSCFGATSCLAAALFGVGAVLVASVIAFSILKIIGAIYLAFLGVRVWRAPPVPSGDARPPSSSCWRAFIHVGLVALLSPQAVLFFMVLVPQFINLHAPLLPQFAVMVASVLAGRTAASASYAFFASYARCFIHTRRTQHVANAVSGSLLMAQGIAAATWSVLAL